MSQNPEGRRELPRGGVGDDTAPRGGGPVPLASVIAEVFEGLDRRAQPPAWQEAPPRRWIDEEVDLPEGDG